MQEVGKTCSLTHLIIPGEMLLLMKKCSFKIQNRDVMVLFMLLTLKKKETFFFPWEYQLKATAELHQVN